jgi:hypothetical protein
LAVLALLLAGIELLAAVALDCGLLGVLLVVFAAAAPVEFTFVDPLFAVGLAAVAAAGLLEPAAPFVATSFFLAVEELLPALAAGAGVPDGLGFAALFWPFCAVAIVAMAVASARI